MITGATDGIGLALARRCAERNERLILVGRRPLASLEDPLFSAATYCEADLSGRGCEGEGVYAIDVLVHNAGTGYWGPAEGQGTDDIHRVVAVNLEAPVRLTHALFPRVLATRDHILFIGSVVAVLPCPDYAVYGATKAAIDGLTRSLAYEVGRSVTVQVIHPGATRTGFHEKIGVADPRIDWRGFPTAAQVARKIESRVARPGRRRRRFVIGVGNRIGWALGRRIPRLIDASIKPYPNDRDGCQPLTDELAIESGHAVVTGAAAGVGRALVARLARDGVSITGVDVDEERSRSLEREFAGVDPVVRCKVGDLGDRDGLDDTVATLLEGDPVDVLVHNAGINAVGRLPSLDLGTLMKIIAVNLTAPMVLTARLLEAGQIRRGGTIVFVSSLSHYVGYPGASVYAATKDGLASYARSLRVALRELDINVLTVFPGPTRTEHARRHSPDNSREHKRTLPEDLADRVVRAIKRRRRSLIPGWTNRQVAWLGAWLPAVTERAMARSILGDRGDG
jgi:short-subunit dehydrogenase